MPARTSARLLRRLAREPLTHLVLVGAVLFATDAVRRDWAAARSASHSIEVPVDVLGALSVDGRIEGDVSEARDALQRRLDEEILYREALRRGLQANPGALARLIDIGRFVGADETGSQASLVENVVSLGLQEGDPVLRAQLVAKMRLVLAQSETPDAPSDDDLAAFLGDHRLRFLGPARMSLTHVFFSADRRGEEARGDAERLHRRLALRPEALLAGADRGDPFWAGNPVEAKSAVELDAMFGSGFGDAVSHLEVGTWSRPIPSAYGIHLVRLDDVTPAAVPPLETIRGRLTAQWRRHRRQARVAEGLRGLRRRYDVRFVSGRPSPTGSLPGTQPSR